METSVGSEVPIETLLKMVHLEQYVNKVIDYTQRYNNSNSLYYSPHNLIGKYEKYPLYGDAVEAYSLRKYGKWWKNSENYQKNYRPQDFDHLGAEDYVIVEFESLVVPREVYIYEVFNPGAIVRIWGNNSDGKHWILLSEEMPRLCLPVARKFSPKIRKINSLINTLRIEFNQSHLEYHTSIEAVLLAGYQPLTTLQCSVIMNGFIKKYPNVSIKEKSIETNGETDEEKRDYFENLPYEVILHIFKYLDLKSLSRCARVNRRLNQAAADPLFYQNLNLKHYWQLVDCDTLWYFMEKCRNLRKLDVSWCGNGIDGFSLILASLISVNYSTLTHISLGNCKFISPEIIMELLCCQNIVELRLNYTNACLNPNFGSIMYLNKLVCLDLTATSITDEDLIKMLREFSNLQHLVLDLCENLLRLDSVVETVAYYNKQLRTWSSWKALSLTADGIKLFGNCPNITELDLGWCLASRDPGDCLGYIAKGCPMLKRLILSEWRALNDQQLLPIIVNCKELNQLDFFGLLNITPEVCEKALVFLPKLRLLDISYCESIRPEEVEIWRRQYPHITVQCCQ